MKERMEIVFGIIGVAGLAYACPTLFVSALALMGTVAIVLGGK